MDTTQNAPQANGPVDVDAILAKVNVPPKFQGIYGKAVLSGMRIMFDKRSVSMTQKQLAQPGPLAKNIADGIVALVYMLFRQSNSTLPPQIIVPLTFTLTLKAFDYVQKSGNAQATKQVLGDAMEQALTTVMQKFGVSPDQVSQIVQQQKGAATAPTAPSAAPPVAPPASPPAGGMLAKGE
jgi:hypothetical protein